MDDEKAIIHDNYERQNTLEIKLVDSNNFTRDSLKDFQRYQEVKNVYRLQDGNLTLVYNPFTEDWDAARLIEKAEEILSGRYVTYCAYEENRVVGEIMLIPKLLISRYCRLSHATVSQSGN